MTQAITRRVNVAGGVLRRATRILVQEWLEVSGRVGDRSYEAYMQSQEFDPETTLLHCWCIWRTNEMTKWNRTYVTLAYVVGSGYTQLEYQSEEYNVNI